VKFLSRLSSLSAPLSKRQGALLAASVTAGALVAISCGRNEPEQGAQIQDFTERQLMGVHKDSAGNSMPGKTLSLTFDDGLGSRSLELARFLKAEGIEATFFLNGVNGRTDDMREIQKMNHLIANHTHNHLDMQKGSTNKINQVVATDNMIKPFVTGNMFLFRAPFGSWNGNVASFLNNNGLRKYVGSVFWDIGGQLGGGYAADWDCWPKGVSVKSCGDMYVKEATDKGRGIVLMHDIHSKTVDMVKYIVPILKSRGFRFVRLDAVPSVAEQLRKAGGKPGTRFGGGAPVPVGVIECPSGYSLLKVGSAGGQLCVNGTDAWGPFTEEMKAGCVAAGGGPACESDRWGQAFALSLRGTGLCARGASFDEETGYCTEGANAFGPFPKALVDKCLAAGGGEVACRSARWNRNFLKNILK
jgi:peptidoglycan-N-acetylglucosamine deacetylase